MYSKHWDSSSWRDLLVPEHIAPWRGRVSMLNDMREVLGSALLALGYSPNSSDMGELKAAASMLAAQKPYLAKYDS